MARRGVEWRGPEVRQAVLDATRKAIDQTLATCVTLAKSNHWWVNRTGTLEGSIQFRPANVSGNKVTGQWGSFSVRYALPLEVKQSYLRAAADQEYPKLADRIRVNLKAKGF